MHRIALLIALASFALLLGAASAEAVTGPVYGYGFEWVRDDDGDGIPNRLDPDWIPPEDGTGYKMKHSFSLPTLCASFEGDQSGHTYRLRWQHLRGKHQVPSPDPLADQIRDRFRDRLQDGTCDEVRLRLRDQSCK